MDTNTLTYLKTHIRTISQQAIDGDLLCRRILNLYYQYRAWNLNVTTRALLEAEVKKYREREEGVKA